MAHSHPAGVRTADLASKAADPRLSNKFAGLPAPPGSTPFEVSDHLRWAEIPNSLSKYNCWNAMLICAFLANGIRSASIQSAYMMGKIDLGIINTHEYRRVFDASTIEVPDERTLMLDVPRGSFLGFVRGGTLIHAMIYVERQFGAGTANGCIFSAATAGWEALNLGEFFNRDRKANSKVRMIARPVNEQVI